MRIEQLLSTLVEERKNETVFIDIGGFVFPFNADMGVRTKNESLCALTETETQMLGNAMVYLIWHARDKEYVASVRKRVHEQIA